MPRAGAEVFIHLAAPCRVTPIRHRLPRWAKPQAGGGSCELRLRQKAVRPVMPPSFRASSLFIYHCGFLIFDGRIRNIAQAGGWKCI